MEAPGFDEDGLSRVLFTLITMKMTAATPATSTKEETTIIAVSSPLLRPPDDELAVQLLDALI